jgi:hypothetical protein
MLELRVFSLYESFEECWPSGTYFVEEDLMIL